MSGRPALLIKVGGNDLEKDGFLPLLAQAIAAQSIDYDCVVVHGGGRTIDDMMTRLDLTPDYVDGQRITNQDTLAVTEMVLSGQVNKILVRALLDAGVDAAGLSGVDGRLMQAEVWSAQMPLVGRVMQVRTEILQALWQIGITPVISPVSMGETGALNVNADHAAGAIAGAIRAERAVFITNMPGVMQLEQLLTRITRQEVQQLIDDGHIYGGMIPKVQAALDALARGAQAAVICNLEGFSQCRGTVIVNERVRNV